MVQLILALAKAVIALLHIASVNARSRGDHEAVEELNNLENAVKFNLPDK